MPSLHERMMQKHGGDLSGSNHKGMPKDITSYDITFRSKRKIAERTYEFSFEKPKGFVYKASQHGPMTLIDAPETDDEGNARFWSFASMPSEPDLQFAMRMRDTAFKRTLSQLKPGTEVLWQMRKNTPHDSFALQDAADAKRPAIFLIGGIGIVPVFSMMKDALKHESKHRITLFYANRRPEDAPYLKGLQRLAKQHADVFRFVPTMSQAEKSAVAWRGENGYISEAMVKKYAPDLNAPIHYIVGLTEMVVAMQGLLAEIGVSKNSIRAEEFGAFTTAHASQQSKRRSRMALFIIAALVVIMLIGTLLPPLLVKADHSKKHIEIQVMALWVVAMLAVVFVKVKLIRRHRGRKV